MPEQAREMCDATPRIAMRSSSSDGIARARGSYTAGPVYLLNYGLPQVTAQFTDYALMQQMQAFIAVILCKSATRRPRVS